MTEPEAMHRAWVVIGLGAVFLFLAALQLWAGKALIGFGNTWHRSPWVLRRKEPGLFWFQVGLFAALGLFSTAIGASRLLHII